MPAFRTFYANLGIFLRFPYIFLEYFRFCFVNNAYICSEF